MPEETPQQGPVTVDDLLLMIGSRDAQILGLQRQLQNCQALIEELNKLKGDAKKGGA